MEAALKERDTQIMATELLENLGRYGPKRVGMDHERVEVPCGSRMGTNRGGASARSAAEIVCAKFGRLVVSGLGRNWRHVERASHLALALSVAAVYGHPVISMASAVEALEALYVDRRHRVTSLIVTAAVKPLLNLETQGDPRCQMTSSIVPTSHVISEAQPPPKTSYP